MTTMEIDVDIDQTPRRPRGRPRSDTPNHRTDYIAALNRRNYYIASRGWWPTRRIDFPESLEQTLSRVADRAQVETAA
jgi:hypothetical protein